VPLQLRWRRRWIARRALCRIYAQLEQCTRPALLWYPLHQNAQALSKAHIIESGPSARMLAGCLTSKNFT